MWTAPWTGERKPLIWGHRKAEFLRSGLDGPNQLENPHEIDFYAQAISKFVAIGRKLTYAA
jgi:hypothetical protein